MRGAAEPVREQQYSRETISSEFSLSPADKSRIVFTAVHQLTKLCGDRASWFGPELSRMCPSRQERLSIKVKVPAGCCFDFKTRHMSTYTNTNTHTHLQALYCNLLITNGSFRGQCSPFMSYQEDPQTAQLQVHNSVETSRGPPPRPEGMPAGYVICRILYLINIL